MDDRGALRRNTSSAFGVNARMALVSREINVAESKLRRYRIKIGVGKLTVTEKWGISETNRSGELVQIFLFRISHVYYLHAQLQNFKYCGP